MPHAFATKVAVCFTRQLHIAHYRPIALERRIHPFGLNRKGAAVVVGHAVDQENRRLDAVGVREGTHARVDRVRFPVRSLFLLKSEGCQGAIVGAAARDAGAKDIRVREQIGRHECTVAVTSDADTIAIGDTQFDDFIHRSLRTGDELFDIRVIRFLVTFPDNRHRWSIEHAVALRQHEEMTGTRRSHEQIG